MTGAIPEYAGVTLIPDLRGRPCMFQGLTCRIQRWLRHQSRYRKRCCRYAKHTQPRTGNVLSEPPEKDPGLHAVFYKTFSSMDTECGVMPGHLQGRPKVPSDGAVRQNSQKPQRMGWLLPWLCRSVRTRAFCWNRRMLDSQQKARVSRQNAMIKVMLATVYCRPASRFASWK